MAISSAQKAVIPTKEDQEFAASALQTLQRRFGISAEDSPSEMVELPRAVAQLFRTVLRHMAKGHAVFICPVDRELSTQEAANFLGVSRPHVIKLVDEGKLACTKVGRHRRIKLQDLNKYEAEFRQRQKTALDAIADIGQEIGI